MRLINPIRLAGLCVSLVLTVVAGVAPAGAQCDITGPTTLCGGSAELCGPSGPYFYDWRDPSNHALGDQQCLTVTAPGTYLLKTFDFINGLPAGPCSFTVAAGQDGGTCAISGSASVCEGATTQLCGPDGAAEFEWSGPDGFAAASACVDVGVAGTYQLRVRSGPDACWSSPCELAVAVAPCGGVNCPLTPADWIRQCRGPRFHHHHVAAGDALAAVGACVDARARSIAWGDPGEGLCRALRPHLGLRECALREFAGVLANVCVRDLDLGARRDAVRGIDPKSAVSLAEFAGSVDEWIAAADARLADLARRPAHDRRAKEAYRGIIRVGWQINHGLGIGAVCPRQSVVASGDASIEGGAVVDGDAIEGDAAVEDVSLAEELSDVDQPLALEIVQPNPTPGPARVVYVVSASTSDEVVIGVYDVAGRLVRELDRGTRAPGRYEAAWDGRDTQGGAVKAGAYFVVGRLGAQRIEGRLILLH